MTNNKVDTTIKPKLITKSTKRDVISSLPTEGKYYIVGFLAGGLLQTLILIAIRNGLL